MASSVWGGGHAGGHSAEVPLAPLSGNAAWPLIHHSLPRTAPVGEWVSGNGSRKCGINGGILLSSTVGSSKCGIKGELQGIFFFSAVKLSTTQSVPQHPQYLADTFGLGVEW